MSTTTPEPLGQYHGREADLTQELIAYFRLAAASLGDPDQLEALLDDLCARTMPRSPVRRPLRESGRFSTCATCSGREHESRLEEVYGEAMQAAQAVGGQYYAQAATRLTKLQAEALAVLEQQNPDEFPRILAQMEGIAEHARRQF